MILADHLRPWKEVQRDFQQIEEAKLKAQEEEKLDEQKREHQAQIDAIDAKIEAAKARREENAGELREIDERDRSKLGGTARAARHPEAVQEGRARQPAQPL